MTQEANEQSVLEEAFVDEIIDSEVGADDESNEDRITDSNIAREKALQRQRKEEERKRKETRYPIRRSEVKESGSSKLISALSPEQEKNAANRLFKRAQAIAGLRDDGTPAGELSPLDNILYAKRERVNEINNRLIAGERLIEIIDDAVELKEYLGMAYFNVVGETLEKAFETGVILRKNPKRQQQLLEHRYVGELINFLNRLPAETLEDFGARLSTPYARETRFEEWGDDIPAHFNELHELYRALNESFFGPDAPETTVWQSLTAAPAAITDYPRDRLSNAIYHSLHGENGILTLEHDGKTFAELWAKDPEKAAMVLLEAKDRAMTVWMKETAKQALEETGEVQFGDKTRPIEQARLRSEKFKEPPDPTERTVSEEDLAEKKEEHDKLQEQAAPLEERLKTLQEEYDEAEIKKVQVDAKIVTITELNKTTQYYNQLIGTDTTPQLNAKIQQAETRLEKAKSAQQIASLRDEIRQAKEKLGYIEKRQEAETAKASILAEMEAARVEAETINTRIQQTNTKLDTTVPGTGKTLRELLEEKKGEYEKAQKTFDKESRQIEKKETSPENQHKACATDKWIDIAVNDYTAILERNYGTDIRARMLADIRINHVTGQIRGCEALRELIFNASTTEEFLYDAELAREMLTDYTISKAIISYLHIDPGREVEIEGTTESIQTWMDELEGETGIATELAKARLENKETEIKTHQGELAKVINPLLKEVLKDMRKMSKYEIGELVQRIIRERVEVSALGDPFAETPFEARPAPYRRSADAITRNCGEASFKGSNAIVYENDMTKYYHHRATGADRELGTWKTRTTIWNRDDGGLGFVEHVLVNQGLLSSLPDYAQAASNLGVPPEIIKLAYEGAQKRLVEPTMKWVQLERPQSVHNFSDVESRLRSQYLNADEFSAALCNLMRDEKDHGKRYSLFLSFRPVTLTGIPSVVDGESPVNFRAEMDNMGQVWLINQADKNDRELIDEWIRRQQEKYMESRNLQSLTAADIQALKTIYRQVQIPIGNEVANTLQRRRTTVSATERHAERPQKSIGKRLEPQKEKLKKETKRVRRAVRDFRERRKK